MSQELPFIVGGWYEPATNTVTIRFSDGDEISGDPAHLYRVGLAAQGLVRDYVARAARAGQTADAIASRVGWTQEAVIRFLENADLRRQARTARLRQQAAPAPAAAPEGDGPF